MKVNESGLQLKVRKNAISLNSAGKKNYKMQMISVSQRNRQKIELVFIGEEDPGMDEANFYVY